MDQGYARTTTKQIARLAGVNEATLFRRYGGKPQLLVSAIRQPLQNVPLRTMTATDDVEADLRHIVESYLETNRQVGAIFPLLLVEASRHPELRPALEVAWDNVGYVIRMIEHHQARGTLQKEPPLTTLAAFIGPLLVTGMLRKAHPEQPMIDVDGHVQAFLHGRAQTQPEP
ncbi:MAG: TetR/AcrR family transcriptional regulator [bacterium]|nr:TetR/AcrR family transcriptional regulator [bacterium]